MSYVNAPNFLYADNVMWFGASGSIGLMRAFGIAEAPATVASGLYPTANRAIYVPFVLQTTQTVYRVGWTNGSAAAGNVDCGVYDAAGTKIISSGATAQGTISVAQWVDVTDTVLQPGQYWIGLSASLTSTTFSCSIPAAPLLAACGVLNELTAHPLPATATFAISNTLAYIPIAFLQMRATM